MTVPARLAAAVLHHRRIISATCLHHGCINLHHVCITPVNCFFCAIGLLSIGYLSATSRLPLPAVKPLAKELTLWPVFALKSVRFSRCLAALKPQPFCYTPGKRGQIYFMKKRERFILRRM
ncbi:MAG TPA: hypothetical protein ENI21_07700 [Pseudomonas sabulinigri]|nr:hypothetical protein [Halopseudomonas sabulinigri]